MIVLYLNLGAIQFLQHRHQHERFNHILYWYVLFNFDLETNWYSNIFGYGLADHFSCSCTAWMVSDFRKGIAFLLLPPITNPRGTGQVLFLSQILGTGVGSIFASIFFQKKTLRQWSAAGYMQQKPIMLWHKMPFSITFRIPIIVTTAVETSGQLNNYYCNCIFIFNSTSAIHFFWWPTESQGFCQCHSVIACP